MVLFNLGGLVLLPALLGFTRASTPWLLSILLGLAVASGLLLNLMTYALMALGTVSMLLVSSYRW